MALLAIAHSAEAEGSTAAMAPTLIILSDVEHEPAPGAEEAEVVEFPASDAKRSSLFDRPKPKQAPDGQRLRPSQMRRRADGHEDPSTERNARPSALRRSNLSGVGAILR